MYSTDDIKTCDHTKHSIVLRYETTSFYNTVVVFLVLLVMCCVMLGAVPKKHSTVVVSEAVRETGAANGITG